MGACNDHPLSDTGGKHEENSIHYLQERLVRTWQVVAGASCYYRFALMPASSDSGLIAWGVRDTCSNLIREYPSHSARRTSPASSHPSG